MAPRAFPFVAARRPVVLGSVGGAALAALGFAWAAATGRVYEVDGTYLAVVGGSIAFALAFVPWQLLRNARRAAAQLGAFEVHEDGVRWRRGDGSVGLEVAWSDVTRATVDARNATIALTRRDAGPVVLSVLSQHGVPSGFVVVDHFDDLAAAVRARVPTDDHAGSGDPAAGRRTLGLGALCLGVSGVMYGLNTAARSALGWDRLVLPMPLFVAAVGALVVVAGARLSAGSGPLVSPLYGRDYARKVVRFLVVAFVANGVLVAMINLVRPN